MNLCAKRYIHTIKPIKRINVTGYSTRWLLCLILLVRLSLLIITLSLLYTTWCSWCLWQLLLTVSGCFSWVEPKWPSTSHASSSFSTLTRSHTPSPFLLKSSTSSSSTSFFEFDLAGFIYKLSYASHDPAISALLKRSSQWLSRAAVRDIKSIMLYIRERGWW